MRKSGSVMSVFSCMLMVLACMIFGTLPDVQAAQTGRSNRDYSELERQIGTANGLNAYDYTIESWEVLSGAVEKGNRLLEGDTTQEELDGAAEDIELAMEALVNMDYSALIDTLDLVYARIDEDPERHDLWYRLDKAVDKARPLLVSGDQQAVDEMAVQLQELLAELEALGENMPSQPQTIIQEVEVEVPPNADFCNIPMHSIWPIALLVSGLLNVLLFASLMIVLLHRRKTVDDTPLVDYDIDEDSEF